MTDVMLADALGERWPSWAEPVSQLFQSVPLAAQGKVLCWPASAEAAAMLQQACAKAGSEAIEMAAAATPAEVQQTIACHQPGVVVCPPEVFGWVSKLAFLGGCAAIYTCSAAGEGTLLDRARHFRSS